MSAIIIATLKITDPEKLTAYREHAGAAIKKHGGEPIAAGAYVATLEGPEQDLNAAAIFKFADEQSAKDWIQDPQLSDVHSLRNQAGQSTIILISTPS